MLRVVTLAAHRLPNGASLRLDWVLVKGMNQAVLPRFRYYLGIS